MKTVYALALIAPLAACASLPGGGLASLGARDAAWPETRPLDAPIAPVPAPSRRHFHTMDVINLSDGSQRRLSVSRFGNGVRVRESDGCVWTRVADWFSPSDSWAHCGSSGDWRTAQASVQRVSSLYPLRLGATGAYKRVATSAAGDVSTRTTLCEVTGAESVTRPDGATSAAHVVVCEDGRIRRTTWFSPTEGPVAYREERLNGRLREAWVRKN